MGIINAIIDFFLSLFTRKTKQERQLIKEQKALEKKIKDFDKKIKEVENEDHDINDNIDYFND
jgi:septal ring factor EnvC (AmiA/AmiB activator)